MVTTIPHQQTFKGNPLSLDLSKVHGIEIIKGNSGDDILTGSPHEDNTLLAGDGHNTLTDMGGSNSFVAGMGNNNITAGGGADSLFYPGTDQPANWNRDRDFHQYRIAGIVVNMTAGEVEHVWGSNGFTTETYAVDIPDPAELNALDTPDAPLADRLGIPSGQFKKTKIFTDQLLGIDILYGTSARDIYTGSDADEVFAPLGGADLVDMGGGDDTTLITVFDNSGAYFDGGEGISDTLSFRVKEMQQGINFAFQPGVFNFPNGTYFNFTGFERVAGTPFDDTFYGDGDNNTFVTNLGNDRAYGRSGSDSFQSDWGYNLLHGGRGGDLVMYTYLDFNNAAVDTRNASGLEIRLGSMKVEGGELVPDTRRLTDSLPDIPGFQQLKDLESRSGQSLLTLPCMDDEEASESGSGSGSGSGSAPASGSCQTGYTLVYQDDGSVLKDILIDIESAAGSSGNDEIWLGQISGQAFAYGGGGNDTLYDIYGGGTLQGNTGNDELFALGLGGKGSVSWGGAGYDHHHGSPFSDTMIADQDADLMQGGEGADVYSVALNAAGSRIEDPDAKSALILSGDELVPFAVNFTLDASFNLLSLGVDDKELVQIDITPIKKHIRQDGSLVTSRFITDFYTQWPYMRFYNTTDSTDTDSSVTVTSTLLIDYYAIVLNDDLRLDNHFIATPEKSVIMGGIGNDMLATQDPDADPDTDNSASVDEATIPPPTTASLPVIYELHGEQGNDEFYVTNGRARVFPGDGRNTLYMGESARAEVYLAQDPEQTLTVKFLSRARAEDARFQHLQSLNLQGSDIRHGGQPTPVPGRYGMNQAQRLSPNDWLGLPVIIQGREWFIALHFKVQLPPSDRSHLVPLLDFVSSDNLYHLELMTNAQGELRLAIFSGTETLFTLSEEHCFVSGEWTHIALTFDRDEDHQITLYKEGERVKKQSGPVFDRVIWTNNYLGKSPSSGVNGGRYLQEVIQADSLTLSDQLPDSDFIHYLASSPSGEAFSFAVDCPDARLFCSAVPDTLEFIDKKTNGEINEYIIMDGRDFIQSRFMAGFLESVEPVRNRLFNVDSDSTSVEFDAFVERAVLTPLGGNADKLVVDVYDDAHVLFRRFGNDLVVYRADTDPLQADIALHEFPGSLLVQGYFNQDGQSVERIIVNDRLVNPDEVWRSTETFPSIADWLARSSVNEVRLLPDGADLLAYFGNNSLDPRWSLYNLWPLRWHEFTSLSPQRSVQFKDGASGAVSLSFRDLSELAGVYEALLISHVEQLLANDEPGESGSDGELVIEATNAPTTNAPTTQEPVQSLLTRIEHMGAATAFNVTSVIDSPGFVSTQDAVVQLATDLPDQRVTDGLSSKYLLAGGDDRLSIQDFSWTYLSGGPGIDLLVQQVTLNQTVHMNFETGQVSLPPRIIGQVVDFEKLKWSVETPGVIRTGEGLQEISLEQTRLALETGAGTLTVQAGKNSDLQLLPGDAKAATTVNCNEDARVSELVLNSEVLGEPGRWMIKYITPIRLHGNEITGEPVTRLPLTTRSAYVTSIPVPLPHPTVAPEPGEQRLETGGTMTLAAFITIRSRPQQSVVVLQLSDPAYGGLTIKVTPALNWWLTVNDPQATESEVMLYFPRFFAGAQKHHMLLSFDGSDTLTLFRDGQPVLQDSLPVLHKAERTLKVPGHGLSDDASGITVDTLVILPVNVRQLMATHLANAFDGQVFRLGFNHPGGSVTLVSCLPETILLNNRSMTFPEFQNYIVHEAENELDGDDIEPTVSVTPAASSVPVTLAGLISTPEPVEITPTRHYQTLEVTPTKPFTFNSETLFETFVALSTAMEAGLEATPMPESPVDSEEEEDPEPVFPEREYEVPSVQDIPVEERIIAGSGSGSGDGSTDNDKPYEGGQWTRFDELVETACVQLFTAESGDGSGSGELRELVAPCNEKPTSMIDYEHASSGSGSGFGSGSGIEYSEMEAQQYCSDCPVLNLRYSETSGKSTVVNLNNGTVHVGDELALMAENLNGIYWESQDQAHLMGKPGFSEFKLGPLAMNTEIHPGSGYNIIQSLTPEKNAILLDRASGHAVINDELGSVHLNFTSGLTFADILVFKVNLEASAGSLHINTNYYEFSLLEHNSNEHTYDSLKRMADLFGTAGTVSALDTSGDRELTINPDALNRMVQATHAFLGGQWWHNSRKPHHSIKPYSLFPADNNSPEPQLSEGNYETVFILAINIFLFSRFSRHCFIRNQCCYKFSSAATRSMAVFPWRRRIEPGR